MVFPATPLNVEVSIALSADLSDPGSWSWTDITSYVREGRKIRIRRGRSSERSTVPPSRCTLTVDNTDGRFCRFLPTGAWYGQIGKNTPLRVRVDNGSGYVTRFIGYVAGWPPTWDPSETDQTVELTADGILRRLGQGRVLRSALSRAILGSVPSVYWPLDDSSDATSAASGLAGGTPLTVGGDVVFGGTSLLPAGSSAAVDLSGGGSLTASTGIAAGAVASWEMEVCVGWDTLPGSGVEPVILAFDTPGSSILRWGMVLVDTGSERRLGVWYTDGITTTMGSSGSLPAVEAGRVYHFRILLEQSGANVNYARFRDGDANSSGVAASVTLCAPTKLTLNPFSTPTGQAPSVCHAAAWTPARAAATTYAAADGYAGENAHDRVERLCAEEGIAVTVTATDSQNMGPQRSDTLLNLLRECAVADFGILYEPLATAGLAYRSSTDRYNETAVVTLEYDERHIAPPFDPTDDDRDFFNDVTASRPGGSSARETDEDSITAVGVYDTTISANAEDDNQLQHIAGWGLNLGLVDELRWPAVKLNLLGVPTLIDSWMAAELGDQLHITGHPSPLAPDDIRQIIEGYDETFGSYQYDVTVNLSPASGWDVGELDDAATARLQADDSALFASVSSSATTWSVRPNGIRWTTDAADLTTDPFVIVGGEVVQVATIANATVLVNTASASHGDNASLSPALPASIASGDQLFLFAAIRNTAGEVQTPAGWTSVLELGVDSIALFRKTAGSSESSPTVTFTGGAAGDTTSAVICAFRGLTSSRITFSANQSNSSAQNITFPALTMKEITGQTDQCLVLLLAWKQDDWTSVAVPSGFTELGEPFTTTGNDQALYWAYQLQTHAADLESGTLTVTGGGSAVSRARLVAFAGLQTFTIAARSVNGVVKSHAADDIVQQYIPERLGL